MNKTKKCSAKWMNRRQRVCPALLALTLALTLALYPCLSAATPLYAAAAQKVKTYSFEEVRDLAMQHSSEIIRQQNSLKQADYNKSSTLTNYQNQAFNFYANPEMNISESTLYSLQENYESAVTAYEDTEEALKKLGPKVAYQAQKLYIDILQLETQMEIQELEIKRLKNEYELTQIKASFGVLTQAQLRNMKTSWDNAIETLENQKKTMKSSRDNMLEYLGLPDGSDFMLEKTPKLGEYEKTFDEEEVLKQALKNSLSLRQAQESLTIWKIKGRPISLWQTIPRRSGSR